MCIQGDIKGGISAPTPEASLRKNPAQEIRCQRQGARQRKAQDKFSCRHALRNHTKKTITAISTDVNKAGPAQGYLVVPPSCVLPSSALMHSPSHLLVTDAQPPERGALSPLGYRLANYRIRKYRIRQMKMAFISIPEKMTPSARYFLFRYFIQAAYPICPCNRKACGYISPVLQLHPQSGSSPNGASMPIC